MDIVISGASGFVGKNLINGLKNSERGIISITRSVKQTGEISWEQYFNDASNIKHDVFIHLAGKAHDLKNTSNYEEYFEINTGLTIKTFDLFLKSKAQIFIYISSVKAAADSVNGVLTEDVIANPQTAYGQSKRQAETYILNAIMPPGKRLFVLRPCMIHGPGNKGNLNLLYKFVKRGIPYPLAGFNNKRSFLSIANLIFAIEKLIENPNIAGDIYNIADDEPLSTNDVIKIIAKTSNLKAYLWKINPGLIRKLALLGDKLHFPLNSERLIKLTENFVVSNSKIKKALNINQFPLTSEEGLQLTIESFQSQ